MTGLDERTTANMDVTLEEVFAGLPTAAITKAESMSPKG
jgi:hypothetical protein